MLPSQPETAALPTADAPPCAQTYVPPAGPGPAPSTPLPLLSQCAGGRTKPCTNPAAVPRRRCSWLPPPVELPPFHADLLFQFVEQRGIVSPHCFHQAGNQQVA